METYAKRIAVRVFHNMTLGLKETLMEFFPIEQRSQHLSEIFSMASHQIASFFTPHINKINEVSYKDDSTTLSILGIKERHSFSRSQFLC